MDEEKVNRRMSAGGVLGLNAPADSKNLEDAQALDAAAAAAATLDSYNKSQHDKGDDIEAKEGGSTASARARARAKLSKPSRSKEMRRQSAALQSDLERLMAGEDSNSEAGAAEVASAAKKKKKKRKRKANAMQWYGVAKGNDTGVWYTNFKGIKHLVHGVKPSLYEGFETEAEAWDFVKNHRDHHEGAKQKSARKARESARAEARAKHFPVTSPITTPASAGGHEFVATPRGGVATPGPRSEPNTDDRDFIKGSDESDSDMPPLDGDDDDYQPGDSEFEDSGEDSSESEVDALPNRRTTKEIIREAEKAAYQRGIAAARAEAARAAGKATSSKIAREMSAAAAAIQSRQDKLDADLRRAKQNSLEEVAEPDARKPSRSRSRSNTRRRYTRHKRNKKKKKRKQKKRRKKKRKQKKKKKKKKKQKKKRRKNKK